MGSFKRKVLSIISLLLLFLTTTANPVFAATEVKVTSAEILGSKLMIVFSEPIDPASINENSLYLLGQNGRIGREVQSAQNNRRLMVRLRPSRFYELFQPLLLVMTPEIKGVSTAGLQRGLVKAFNLVEPVYDRKKPFFEKKIIQVSTDPRIELEVLDLRVFWHKDRFRGKGLKLFDRFEKEDWRQMEKCWDDEHKEKEHRFGKFEALKHSRLHRPVLTVAGIADGQTIDHDVQINFSASDVDNDLRLLHALLDFQGFSSGTTIRVRGQHWFFALAADVWHLFDYRLINFTIAKTPLEFIALTPDADFSTREAPLLIQGEVAGAAKLTINEIEVPLAAGKFQKNFTLNAGANLFKVVAMDGDNNKIERSFTATYIVDNEPPRITITTPLNSSFFNVAVTAVSGQIIDQSRVDTVTVNGLPAIVSGQTFTLAALSLTSEGLNNIIVQATDEYNNVGNAQIAVTLDTIAPEITVTSPMAGAMVNLSLLNVNGKAEDVNLLKVFSTGTQGQVVGNNFYLEGLPLAEGQNQLVIEAEDRAGNKSQKSLILVLDSLPPDLQITAPVVNALLSTPAVTVSGTVTDAHGVEVKVNDIEANVDNGNYSGLIPLRQGANHITVVARDNAGNSVTKTRDVIVDSLPPQLSFLTPADNAILNSRTIVVAGSFSEANIASIKVNGTSAAIDNQTFTLAALPLQEGLNSIEALAVDTAGNQGALKISVTVDTRAPEIKSVLPAAGMGQVAVESRIEIEFSENILPASLSDAAIYVSKANGEKIVGSLTLENGNMVKFFPGSPLPDSAVLTVHVTAAISDLAGNGLPTPYSGNFSTVDLTPPPPPELQSIPERTTLTKIDVAGTAEAGSRIMISGGAATMEIMTAADGTFSSTVMLKPGQLNQLWFNAVDAAGNQSLPAQLAIYQEAANFSIVDAIYENNQVQVIFSNPVNSASLNTTSLKVSTLHGVESGSISVSNETALFQPTADLSDQAFLLEISTAVIDSNGDHLPTPFAKMFNQQGAQTIVQGEVYDDSTGLPLFGATVKLIDVNGSAPQAPAPQALTTKEGQYALLLPAEACTLRIEKEGFCRSDRAVTSLSGFSATVFDACLAPQNAIEYSLKPEGCTVATTQESAISLTIPPGAVAEEKKIRISQISSQALQGRLPFGWSPLTVIDIWPATITFAAPATLSMPLAPALSLPESSTLVLARWNDQTFKWIAVSIITIDMGGITPPLQPITTPIVGAGLSRPEIPITSTGQYALLIADTAPVAPAAAVAGEPLPAVPASVIPALITAKLEFIPAEIYPGQSTSGSLLINTLAPVSSGVPVQAKVSESHELLSGSKALYAPYTVDLTAFYNGENQLRLDFNLSPNQEIALADLKIGSLDTDLNRYSSGTTGMVVGSEGGSVSGEDGIEATLEAGAVEQPLAVSLKKTAAEALSKAVPADFKFLGAIEFSISGSTLRKSAVLAMELPQEVLDEISPGAQLMLCRLARIDNVYVYLSAQTAFIAAGKIKNTGEAQALLPFSGVRIGGTYVFLQALSPAGFFKGLVTDKDKNLPYKDAAVTVSGHDIFSLSLASGAYAQIAFLGNRQLEARNRLNNDLGSASGNVAAGGEIKTLDIAILPTGPTVAGISPANMAETVPLNSKVQVIFSEPVRAASFNGNNFYISAGPQKLTGIYKLSPDALQGEFVPTLPLPSDKIINVTLSTGIQDLSGNPMVMGFSSTFKTKDVVPPTSDFTKIHKYIPDEEGYCTIEGSAGAIEPGASLRVFNDRTLETATTSGLSDGSFKDVLIAATISDTLLVSVIDLAGNEIVVDPGPYVSKDGKGAILDAKAAEFITIPPDPLALGIKIAANTFNAPVLVRLEAVTDARELAIAPADFSRLQAIKVDFSGARPALPWKVSIPAPAGLPAGASFFIAHEVTVFGEKKLMIVDTCALNNGRIEVNSPPWPGLPQVESAVLSILATSMSWSMVSGYSPSASAMVSAMDLVYIPGGWSTQQFIFPVRAGQDFTLTVRDLDTGETLFSGVKTASDVPGQIYEFSGNLASDFERPMLLSASGLNVSTCQWTATKTSLGNLTIEPAGSDCKISATAKTAVPDGNIRIQIFHLDQLTGKEIVTTIVEKAKGDGSFDISIPADTIKFGDKMVLSIEKDNVALDREFALDFSESLQKKDIENAVRLKEIVSGKETPCAVELAANQTTVLVKPKQTLKEDTRYSLECRDIKDSSNNALNLTVDFRTKKSTGLDLAETGGAWESVLFGKYMIVAAGDSGLKIVDVSNPARLSVVGVYTAFANVRGVSLYTTAAGTTYALMVGGSMNDFGYLKMIDISDPRQPHQVKSQIVAGNAEGSNLPAGIPMRVRIAGDYAFVAVYGYEAGMIAVDLTKMTAGSNKTCIMGSFAADYISDLEVFVDESKNTDGTVSKTVHALLLIDYYGLKMVNVTNPSQIVAEGFYELPGRDHVRGLDVAIKYYCLDKDGDGRFGEKEAANEDLDKDDRKGEDEYGDFAFFTFPDRRELYVLDITNRSGEFSKVGAVVFKDAGGLGDMFFSQTAKKLYLCDMTQGVYMLDMKNPIGFELDINNDGRDDRIAATIKTNAITRYGLVVDEKLQMLYAGDLERGIQSVKLANPQVRIMVMGDDGKYREEPYLQPWGLEGSDYASGYPQNKDIYVMVYLPQIAAEPGMQVKAELWSLNVAGAPLAPWGLLPTMPLTFISGQQLLLSSNAGAKPEDEAYNLFKSEPIRLTVDAKDDQGALKLLSGDLIRAFLVFSDTLSNELTYLPANDLEQGYGEKTALRAEAPKNEKQEPANNPSTGSGETSFAGPGLLDVPSVSGVYLHSGEFFNIETDLRIPGRGFDFAFTRRYESQSIFSGPLGWNWDHTYNRRLQELPNGDILYFNGSGRRERYKAKKSGSIITGYEAPVGSFTELKKRQDGTFTLINSDRFIEIFDPAGRLSRLQDRNANKMEFYYDFAGQLSAVEDTMGRLIVFEYYPVLMTADGTKLTPESGRLQSVRDFTDRTVIYEYDDKGDLVKATLGERNKQYTYSTASFTNDLEKGHNLLSITDPNNQKYLTLTYDDKDKLTSEKIGSSIVNIAAGSSASTTDGNGHSRSYTHNDKGNPLSITEGGNQTEFAYNADGLVTSVSYPMGNKKEFVYDTANTERRAQSNLLQVKETPDARGGNVLTTTYTYEANTNQVISMTDPKGNRTTYSRQNAAGNIDSVIAPLNATYSYTYNQYGQPTQMTDPKGAVTAYKYYPEASPAGNGAVSDSGRALDPSTGGYLREVVVDQAADKISSAYAYDDVGNITAQIDGENIRAEIEVDKYNQVSSISRGSGDAVLSTSYTHDNNGNKTNKSERGITENYNYNTANLPLDMTRTGSGLTQQFIYTYDNNFNLKTITYPKGNQDTFTYDERNLLTGKSLGGITTLGFAHDDNGNQTGFTDGEHNVWQTIYDGHDRVTGKSDPLNNGINYTLDNNSNLTGVSGPENLMVSNQFDELNRMSENTVAGNITQRFHFDTSGNLVQYTSANGFAIKSTFSGAGLLKTTSDPLGNAGSYAYDKRALPLNINETENGGRSLSHSISYNALGNVNSTDDSMQRKWQHHYDLATQLPQDSIDPENGAVASSYDGLNRLNKGTRYINYNGGTVPADNTYEYDLNNNLVAVIDANNNKTAYQYDDKDRLTTVTYPDSRSESYAYDKNDRLKSLTDANGTIVTNIYDVAGRLTSRTIAPASGIEGPTHESFTYDGLSRLERAENDNTITTLTYDNAGRLTNEKQQTKNNAVITGTYDIASGFDNNGNKTSLTYPSGKALSITPDALDRIATIQSGNNPIAAYTYEGQDKVKGKTLGSSLKLEAEYDDGKRPTSFKYANLLTSKDVIDQAMSWNKVDLKTSETRTDAADQSKNYEYDSAYRLRKSTAAQNETAYDIDPSDNIKQVNEVKEGVSQTVNHDVNNRNQVITLGNKTLTYDNNGNLTKITGNGTTTNYIYDYKNQLLRVESGGTQVEFMYDALGRRIQKKAVYANSSATTKYVYDGHQVIEERDGANLLKSRYAYGNGIDEPVEIEKANAANAMISYLPMQDTNGNVIGLADSTGKLIEKVNYSAYGAPTFIYDHIAPQVDQVRVSDSKVLIRFSEAVDQTSAKSAIKIKQGTNDLSGTITFAEDDKLSVFAPGFALPNALLTIIVTTDLEDKNTNKLAAEFSQGFTYAGSDLMLYDRIAPEIEIIKLVNGKLNVTFTEELDPASITSAIGFTYTTGTINGATTLEDAKTILFTPSSSLSNLTEYTITVKSTVKDLSGKSLVQFSKKFIFSGSDLLIYQKPDPTEHTESYVKNTTLFQGRSFDPETGLYYFRARYLQPELGRFLQSDPAGYKDSLNLYQSFGNNPIDFTDPMGEETWNQFYEREHALIVAREMNVLGKQISSEDDIKENLKSFWLTSIEEQNAFVNNMPSAWQSFWGKTGNSVKAASNYLPQKGGVAVYNALTSDVADRRQKILNSEYVKEGIIDPEYAMRSVQLQESLADISAEGVQFGIDQLQWIAVAGITERIISRGRIVPNAGGKIESFVTGADEIYYRVYSGNKTTGRYLTKVKPKNRMFAIEGLSLPQENTADFIQEVLVPKGKRLQRSRALGAYGRRGGLEQFELIDYLPEKYFRKGVVFK